MAVRVLTSARHTAQGRLQSYLWQQVRHETTLALIKPAVARSPAAYHHIKDLILARGFAVRRERAFRFDDAWAAAFYETHRGRYYYDKLMRMMTSGESVALELERENAVSEWRSLMGTSQHSAYDGHRFAAVEPPTIRYLYGETVTQNAVHGSDSEAEAARETAVIFSWPPGSTVKET